MKLLFFRPAVTALLPLLAAGCALFGTGYTEPNDFDLAAPSATDVAPTTEPVRFGVFRNLSGSDRRFLVRLEGDRMQTDEYNRWLLVPELLLERRFRAELPLPETFAADTPEIKLDCAIYRFEFDRVRQQAVLELTLTARTRGHDRHRQLRFEVPIDGDTPEAAVGAMSAAAARAATAARQLVETAARAR